MVGVGIARMHQRVPFRFGGMRLTAIGVPLTHGECSIPLTFNGYIIYAGASLVARWRSAHTALKPPLGATHSNEPPSPPARRITINTHPANIYLYIAHSLCTLNGWGCKPHSSRMNGRQTVFTEKVTTKTRNTCPLRGGSRRLDSADKDPILGGRPQPTSHSFFSTISVFEQPRHITRATPQLRCASFCYLALAWKRYIIGLPRARMTSSADTAVHSCGYGYGYGPAPFS